MMYMNDLALTWTEITAEHAKLEEGVASKAREAAVQLRKAIRACYEQHAVV